MPNASDTQVRYIQDNTIIRPLQLDDSVPALTALLHRAYAGLAEKGLLYLASHQDDATTKERLSLGFPFVAAVDGQLIGTVTLYPPSPESQCQWYRQENVYSFGQFGILPEFQEYGIGRKLFDCVEAKARELGARELALDTAEGATHLRQWYGRLGFRFVETVSWHVTNYRSVVLSKALK